MTTNADPLEISKFSELAHRWWDPTSEFRPLHEINPLRLEWINARVPLSGKNVIDIGCGGGVLSEAMARKGAKVTGIDLYSAGDIVGGEGSEDLVLRDRRGGVYKRLVVAGNRLAGAVLVGDVADGPWYFDLIQRGADISAIRDHLLFGRAFCEQAA